MNRMRQEILRAALAAPRLDGDRAEQSFCFAEEFAGFGGHFPGYPILPAILQVLLGQLLAERWRGRPLRLATLERAKFTRQLRPGERIDVALEGGERDGLLRCRVQLKGEDEPAASFTLILDEGTSQ